MTPPTVFISYSHDSPAHADRVLELSDRLRAEGVDCILDQYEAPPPEGWPLWMDKNIGSADFVLMICTPTYFRRVMHMEEPGTGLGIKWEGNLIYNRLYRADSNNTQFVPVLFEDCLPEHIPTPLQGASYYRLPQQYDDLYRRLTNQMRIQKPELGKLRQLPPRERKPDYLDIKASLQSGTSPDAAPTAPKKETPTTSLSPSELRQKLIVSFNDSELRDLCFDLGVDYESVEGGTRDAKARELITYLQRRDRLTELIDLCRERRPNVSW